MKVLTVGNGFIAQHLPYTIISERILANTDKITDILNNHSPNVLINCIGFCGIPNIDQCEIEKSKTSLANTIIPIMLAQECEKRNIHFIHIGSGCLFNGDSPFIGGWKETDAANPQSYYSKTKYACDLAIGDMKNVSVLRIRMPISPKNNQRNLINKLKGYNKIIDIPNSVTFTNDLIRCIEFIIKRGVSGVLHITNAEPLSAAQIMTEYKKYDPKYKFEIINEEQLGQLTKAKRSNCLLNTDKLRSFGFEMSNSQEMLQKTLKEYFTKMAEDLALPATDQ